MSEPVYQVDLKDSSEEDTLRYGRSFAQVLKNYRPFLFIVGECFEVSGNVVRHVVDGVVSYTVSGSVYDLKTKDMCIFYQEVASDEREPVAAPVEDPAPAPAAAGQTWDRFSYQNITINWRDFLWGNSSTGTGGQVEIQSGDSTILSIDGA